uniref:Ig-like domain-containing protein n=1 Tax=Poecilia formosa TaxID=48698 RepID=A0A087XWV0_POEFO
LFLGESVTFTCNMTAGYDSNWSYVFHRNGQHIVSKSDVSKFLQLDLTTDLSGRYQCSAYHKDSPGFIKQSNNITLSVAVSNQANVALQHDWSQIYSGEAISMSCEIKGGGNSKWEYEWRTTTSKPPSRERTVHIRASVFSSGDFWCRGRADPFSSTEWSQTCHLRVSDKPRPTVRADKRLIPVGGNVTLTCSVDNPTEWKYYWFRHTGNISEVQTVDEGKSENVISISQGGVYYCQGGRGSPVFFTEESHRITIEKRVSNMASVSLRPDWPVIYSGETITVRCEISGGRNNEWVYEWSKPISDTLPTNEYRIVDASESSSGNYRCLGRNKQDLYSSTEWSDITTVTVSAAPTPVLTVSPSWLSPGASVTLSCEVEHPSAGWRFYWYKAVPDFREHSVQIRWSYSLINDSFNNNRNSAASLTVSPEGQKQTAGFTCRAGRGNPKYFTDYSEPKFVWSAVSHPAASLSVSPDREQHFTSESVTLNCGGNSTEWRVMTPSRIYAWSSLYSYSEKVNGFTTEMIAYRPSTAVYWCESESEGCSNAVNITIHDGDLILVSPVHPVNEGDPVTLGCELRTGNFTSTVGFYKNDKLIQNTVRGELSIPAASASDEGFYRCEHSGKASPQSWVAVKASSSSLPESLIIGLVVGFLLTVLLVIV